MRFSYKIYIRPLSDFCSQLWTPARAAEIESLKSIPRGWKRRCPAIKDQHFWDRILLMEITSTQRRHERYQILYVWQILEQLVPNNGAVKTKWGNRGRMIIIPRSRGSQAIRTLRDSSFTVKSGRLFNALPRYLRDYSR